MYSKGMDTDGMFHGICLCSSSLGGERWCRQAHVDISRNIVERGEGQWVTAVASLQISTARMYVCNVQIYYRIKNCVAECAFQDVILCQP